MNREDSMLTRRQMVREGLALATAVVGGCAGHKQPTAGVSKRLTARSLIGVATSRC